MKNSNHNYILYISEYCLLKQQSASLKHARTDVCASVHACVRAFMCARVFVCLLTSSNTFLLKNKQVTVQKGQKCAGYLKAHLFPHANKSNKSNYMVNHIF